MVLIHFGDFRILFCLPLRWQLIFVFINSGLLYGCNDFEVIFTSTVAERFKVILFVCVSFLPFHSFVVLYNQTVNNKRVHAVGECSNIGAETIIEKILIAVNAKCNEAINEWE